MAESPPGGSGDDDARGTGHVPVGRDPTGSDRIGSDRIGSDDSVTRPRDDEEDGGANRLRPSPPCGTLSTGAAGIVAVSVSCYQ